MNGCCEYRVCQHARRVTDRAIAHETEVFWEYKKAQVPNKSLIGVISVLSQAAHLSIVLPALSFLRDQQDFHQRLVFSYEEQLRELRQEVFEARRIAAGRIMRMRIQELRRQL